MAFGLRPSKSMSMECGLVAGGEWGVGSSLINYFGLPGTKRFLSGKREVPGPRLSGHDRLGQGVVSRVYAMGSHQRVF